MSRLRGVRRRLGGEQATFLAALLQGTALPSGINPDEAAAAASVLTRRAPARRWRTTRRLRALLGSG